MKKGKRLRVVISVLLYNYSLLQAMGPPRIILYSISFGNPDVDQVFSKIVTCVPHPTPEQKGGDVLELRVVSEEKRDSYVKSNSTTSWHIYRLGAQ